MNQVASKLKKDSLQDGKHTMGVSNHPSGRGTIIQNAGEMHLFMCGFLLLEDHLLFYIMFWFPIPDPPVLLIQLCDRSRGSSSLIPLPQTKMWSS